MTDHAADLYGWASDGWPVKDRTGRPKRRREQEAELGWRDVLRANADFPGAYLRFLRRMGIPE